MNGLAILRPLLSVTVTRFESAETTAVVARQGMLFATLEKNRAREGPFDGPACAIGP
jgi:hypothetical protein